MKRGLIALVLAVVAAASLTAAGGGQQVGDKADALFARWTVQTPGCAVAASVDRRVVLEKGYGMADLEHDARIKPATIFEAGSVSKQFTAAAVLLLARDGKLSLDDPVRKYLPELPDYGAPLTIRHLLTHTSGLRDWGAVAALEGWPRTTKAYTHAHVLDIAARQRALNFTPGTQWSYSNTGYNLAAILVARVSGKPFAEFTRERIFEPLGMTHTSWRDDFTRVVPGRAIAYTEAKDGYHQQMPFENVHGNGGLLTTVGDLLRWNANFADPKVGDRAFVEEQERPGRLSDGRSPGYGLGLFVRTYRGVPEISHGGSTAGYRAYLLRFPVQKVSVAVLCNAAGANAEGFARGVADLYLDEAGVKPSVRPAAVPLGAAQLEARAGLYRQAATGWPLTLVLDKGSLRADGAELAAVSDRRFQRLDGDQVFEFGEGGSLLVRPGSGLDEAYQRVDPARPDAAQLAQYAGSYAASGESEVVLHVAVAGQELRLLRRPDSAFVLRPLYADAFMCPLGMFRFVRDAAGHVTGMRYTVDRIWDLRMQRVGE
jgi:CubicO group peptidase (beta-lactamase class C family)